MKTAPDRLPAWAVHAVFSEPKADATITQSDFAFAVSQPMTAGTHVIQVMTAWGQPHEVVVKL